MMRREIMSAIGIVALGLALGAGCERKAAPAKAKPAPRRVDRKPDPPVEPAKPAHPRHEHPHGAHPHPGHAHHHHPHPHPHLDGPDGHHHPH
jgi:hypothetical protein